MIDDIERLTNIVRATEMERDAGDKVADNLRAEIKQLKSLLARAADALEVWIAQAGYITATIPEQKLIAELRKAAQ